LKLRAYLLMIFVVAVWGSTFVLVKNALGDATPAAFNLIRMALAFVILAVAYHRFWRFIRKWHIVAGAVVGLFMTVGYQLQTIGLVYTTPSKSAFITGLVVVIVPLLSVIPCLRPPGTHAPRWNAFLGAGLAFAGIILLTAPTSLRHNGPGFGWSFVLSFLPDPSTINIGDVLTFGCAIAFAFHCLALSHFSPRIAFHSLALLQVGFCALFMALSLPVIEHPHVCWTPRLMVALGITALLATAAAYSIQSWAQSVLPATHMALVLTLEPVFAWITSFLITGERLGLRPASGALLILAGIVVTEVAPQWHLPTAHEA
jgi:drug/metabolite transporter (DMT)-like permease